jgi:hypothetical protein
MADRGGRGDLLQVVRGNPSPSGHFKWPTPDASVSNLNEPLDKWEARREREKAKGQNGNGFGMPLAVAVRQWPTPTSQEGGPEAVMGGTRPSGTKRALTLTTQVVRMEGGGALNPTWVEWLMGFPLGWTVCERWVTRSSRRSRSGSDTGSSSGKAA